MLVLIHLKHSGNKLNNFFNPTTKYPARKPANNAPKNPPLKRN